MFRLIAITVDGSKKNIIMKILMNWNIMQHFSNSVKT